MTSKVHRWYLKLILFNFNYKGHGLLVPEHDRWTSGACRAVLWMQHRRKKQKTFVKVDKYFENMLESTLLLLLLL